MGYSMDRKEVNSRNFTFKNLYKPSEVCARRYEIVSRLVDHFKNNLGKKKAKQRMRTIIIEKHVRKRLCHAISGCAQVKSQNHDPYRESDKHGPFKRCVSIPSSSKCFQRPRSPGSLIFTFNFQELSSNSFNKFCLEISISLPK